MTKIIKTEYSNRVEYTLNGKLHREDGPAIEWNDGTQWWYLNGELYQICGDRMNEVIVKKYSNRIEYTLNGKLHREDGPAIKYNNGDEYWYLNGQYHRENGPAIELANGDKHWYLNGRLHREWYLNGRLHRESGPAVEYANGEKEYWVNGKLHREDGPAINLYWDGGEKQYWINGKRLKFIKNDQMLVYYLKYGSLETNKAYKRKYILNGQPHREDGPAIEYFNGDKEWYLHGKLHRIGGPAIERANGHKEYWIDGKNQKYKIIKQFISRLADYLFLAVKNIMTKTFVRKLPKNSGHPYRSSQKCHECGQLLLKEGEFDGQNSSTQKILHT